MDEAYDIERALKGKRKGGEIRQWRVATYGTDPNTFQIVHGFVYGDTRWTEGSPLRTSVVVKIHYDLNIVETLNTYYTLGEPAPNTEVE